MSTVLVVDDKEMLRDSVAVTLQRPGFTVITATSGEHALELIASRKPDCVVTDLKMPGMTGIALIERAKQIDADLPIVLMTAFGTVETAVKALKLGAFDYITKPFEGDELVIAVKRAMEHARLKRDNEVLRRSAEPVLTASGPNAGADASGFTGIDRVIGDSTPMREVKDKFGAIAESHGTVLISGESGTGKEVVARAIHEASPRAHEPFLAVNCAAMSESLLESELFGHERGAFTGAESLRKGRFELAHRGTLLLDEISEIKPQIQAKLLRVLQERAFERVGSSQTIGVDVRVITTTNRDLAAAVADGSFRQDLFYRLNVLPIELPSLRERSGDVEMLAPHFVRMAAAREGRPPKTITDEAMDLLTRYLWPGNVRELQNLCERAVVLSRGETIDADLIGGWLTIAPQQTIATTASPTSANGDGTHRESKLAPSEQAIAGPYRIAGTEPRPLADLEREVIVQTLERFEGHRQKTAAALGIGVRTLGLKLKKWKEEQLVASSL
jgi:two-component system, NtrC family, response regulator HydG